MKRWLLAAVAALALAGCEYRPDALLGETASGDADAVVVKASYFDPAPAATRHCAKYERTPEFESVTGVWWRWFGGTNEYFYKCVTRRDAPPMDSPAPSS